MDSDGPLICPVDDAACVAGCNDGPYGFDPCPPRPKVEAGTSELVTTFDSGATRDLSTDKLDYEGFLSPLAVQRFAEYMHKHRYQKDGTLRDSDNWQKGIPLEAYMKSKFRHDIELWAMHRGCAVVRPEDPEYVEDIEDTLCAILFNVQGYLHEILKSKMQEVTISER